jgi:hypothetical protein
MHLVLASRNPEYEQDFRLSQIRRLAREARTIAKSQISRSSLKLTHKGRKAKKDARGRAMDSRVATESKADESEDSIQPEHLNLSPTIRTPESTLLSSSDGKSIPPCPGSYQSPMTNALKYQDAKTIMTVREEVEGVATRLKWELVKLSERLAELETGEEELSAWL